MPKWVVNIDTAHTGDNELFLEDSEVEFEIEATDSKAAVIAAVNQLALNKGELIHFIHVSPPIEELN